MKRAHTFMAVVAALGLSLGGCGEPSGTGAGPADTPTVLRRGLAGEMTTFDPLLATDVQSFSVLADLCEGLVGNSADGTLVPGVAESWVIEDGGLRYTFTLRADARWTDGSAVVAADFVNAFRTAVSPDPPTPYDFLFEPLANFAAVNAGDADVDTLGIEAIDDHTLVLNLSTPAPHLMSVLSMPVAYPRHPEGPTYTNGPYELAEHIVNGPIRLRKSPAYWGHDDVEIGEVVYLQITDPFAELTMYRAGELDITGTIPPVHVTELRTSIPDETRIAPQLALYYIAFDLTEPPFNDARLRKALSMAVDRDVLVELIGRGERPALGIVPPGVANHDRASQEWRGLNRDERIRQARTLYEEAGFSKENPLRMTFSYDAGDIHERIAVAVASMWTDAFGASIELDKKEWKYFLDSRSDRGAWDVMRFSWFGDYNDPMTFLEIFHSENIQNLPRYRNDAYDSLLERAATEADPDARRRLMTDAEEMLLSDDPIAPLYFYVSKHLVKPYVTGFENNVLDRHPSKYLGFRAAE